MMRALVLAAAAALGCAGCVDTKGCHMAHDWKPCANTHAEPGAGGTPPAIVELSLPTCAFVDSPSMTGTLHVTDPDFDAQVVDVTFYVGARTSVSQLQLADAGRAGSEWTGTLTIEAVSQAGGAAMEGTSDVRVKVTDLAGNQSVPYCGTFTLLR